MRRTETKKRLGFEALMRIMRQLKNNTPVIKNVLNALITEEAKKRMASLDKNNFSTERAFETEAENRIEKLAAKLLAARSFNDWTDSDQLELEGTVNKKNEGKTHFRIQKELKLNWLIMYGNIIFVYGPASTKPNTSYQLNWLYATETLFDLRYFNSYISKHLSGEDGASVIKDYDTIKKIAVADYLVPIVSNTGWLNRNDPYLTNMRRVNNEEWLEFAKKRFYIDAAPSPYLSVDNLSINNMPAFISAPNVFRVFLNLNLMTAWASPAWNSETQKNWQYFKDGLISEISSDRLRTIAKRFRLPHGSKEAAIVDLIVKTGAASLELYGEN